MEKDLVNKSGDILYYNFQAMPKQVSTRYRQYSPTRMTNAYQAVVDNNQTVRGAARQFGVPVRTLRDRTMGMISVDTVKSGRAPVFELEEEVRIVEHLKEMAQLGYGYTRSEVVDLASDFAVSLGKRESGSPLTLRWYQGFMSRWDELRLVKPRALEIARAKAGNVDNVNAYFKELKGVIQKNNLEDKPHLIFNVDEKGIQQNHSPPAVVAGRHLNAQEVTAQKSSTTTVIGCGNAAGTTIPPFFVFAGARMRQELMAEKSPGADGTVSESGWSNSTIFRRYLEEHFLTYAPGRGEDPILLLLDGHKSHVSIGLVDWAKQHNIILYILPAHTSHFLQPLDVGCYGAFHRIYNNECHKKTRAMSTVVTKYDVCEIACKTYTKALSAENLQAAFKRTGIYPFDEAAIDPDYLLPSNAFSAVPEPEPEPEDKEQEQEAETDNEGVEAEVDGEGDKENELVDEQAEEQTPTMAGDFFITKVQNLKKIKSENPPKSRNTLSKITSGHCITDDDVREKIREHQEPALKRKSNQNKKEKTTKKSKKIPHGESQEPGPSRAPLSQVRRQIVESESESEPESEIPEKDKCCICKLFTPVDVRNSIYIKLTKWVGCDRCSHWVHLGSCTEQRVVRKGDTFFCPHCV